MTKKKTWSCFQCNFLGTKEEVENHECPAEKREKKSKITHTYKCEYCGKPATRNIQTEWHEYRITADGDFKEIDQWDADENHFVCDKHEPNL